MSVVLVREVDRLKRQMLNLSAVVEEHVTISVNALRNRDLDAAKKVIDSDSEIDQMEVDVEEEGLKILALHQPVANDLRFISAVLKINNDLERIGDISANVARSSIRMTKKGPKIPISEELMELGLHVRDMLHDALNNFVNLDSERAVEIYTRDDIADKLARTVRKKCQKAAAKDSGNIAVYVDMIHAARNFERIGDLATNICEDVVYMITGEIVRHGAIVDIEEDDELDPHDRGEL